MAGLPCTVVLVLALFGTVAYSAYVCQTPVSPKVSQTPEKCMNKYETGSEMSNEERQSAVDAINTYRALIANQCDKFKSGKPNAAYFRKMRYTCHFERTFECPNAGARFVSERRVFRRIIDSTDDHSVFYRIAPRLEDIGINKQNKVVDNSVNGADTLRFYLNANAAEIGCFLKKCHGKKYLACQTYTDYDTRCTRLEIAAKATTIVKILNIQFARWNLGYVNRGLSSWRPLHQLSYNMRWNLIASITGKLPYRCGQHPRATVRQAPEPCSADVDTVSRMSKDERRLTVDVMNLHRGFITNQCDAWGSGKPKSANMLKIHYSCELEKQVVFACPKPGPENWKSDGTVFRKINEKEYLVHRTAVMWRHVPSLNKVKIAANTQTLVDANVVGSEFLSFALNNDASEVGCYLNVCHNKGYVACTTGHPVDVTKALYKPGNRCQKNADCTVPGYHICDMEYGLCDKGGSPVTTTTKKPTTTPTTKKPGQGCRKDADCTASASPVCNLQTGLCGPLTCKFSDSSLTIDACKDLRACTEATDKAEPEKQFCRSTVIIADRNNDNTFTVKGFGAAVGEKHLLASVSSKFAKYGNTELFAIVGGTTIYQLRAADVIPQIAIGDPNFNAWGDLALIKLADASTFKFTDYLKVKSVRPGSQDKSLTLRLDADKVKTDNILLQPDAECVKVFHLDGVIKYVKNSNMACGLDADDKGTKFLNGAPLADVALTDGKHALQGIRSMDSLDPGHTNGFLVTKLAPNCDWLSNASDGAVKCV